MLVPFSRFLITALLGGILLVPFSRFLIAALLGGTLLVTFRRFLIAALLGFTARLQLAILTRGLRVGRSRGFVDGHGLCGRCIGEGIAVCLDRGELERTAFGLAGIPDELAQLRDLDHGVFRDRLAVVLQGTGVGCGITVLLDLGDLDVGGLVGVVSALEAGLHRLEGVRLIVVRHLGGECVAGGVGRGFVVNHLSRSFFRDADVLCLCAANVRAFPIRDRDEVDRAGFGQGSVPDDLMEEGAVYDEIATVVGDLQFLTFFILEHQGAALEVVGSTLQFDVEDLDELRGLVGIGTDEERLAQRCVGLVQGDFGRLQVVFTRIGRQLAIDHRAVVAGTAGVGAAGVAATCVGIGAAGVGGVGVVATFTGAAGILLARGQRGRLDFGAFGQRDRGAVGLFAIEDRLGVLFGAVDGFEGDAAVGVLVAHPDQLAKVFLADDLAFCHRFAVQQQRVLVVAVLDDEGRQLEG